MTFDDYDQAMLRTAGPAFRPNDGLLLSALGLCGESGEFADLIKKLTYHGHQIDINKLRKELGDILWYIARAAHALGTSTESIAIENIEKLRQRYPDGFSSERSINREG